MQTKNVWACRFKMQHTFIFSGRNCSVAKLLKKGKFRWRCVNMQSSLFSPSCYTYSRGHKIVKHFKIIIQVLFTTRKVVHDIYKGLETQELIKLGKFGKISKMGRSRAQYPVSLPKIKFWYQWSKITQKQIPKFLRPPQFHLIS